MAEQISDYEYEKMSNSILLTYIQSWDQTNKERLEALVEAANKIGFNAWVAEDDGEWMIAVPNKETKRFELLRNRIRNINRGEFNNKARQIFWILKDYYRKRRWWKKCVQV